MNKKSGTSKDAADKLVKGIRRKTRKQYSAEEKIRIVLAGLRGEESIAALCRREGISESLYYTWSKELAGLTRGNVFDEDGNVREQFILSAAQSKGGKTRTVYLNQRLRRALAEYGAKLYLQDPNRPLFESQKGGHFSANTMCQLFLDIYKAVGLKDASSHSGRRTYITRLANKGVGVRLLAALAAHSHISTTQRYIDVNEEQLSAAVELL